MQAPSETDSHGLRTHRTPPVNAPVGNHMEGIPDHAQAPAGPATAIPFPARN